ncbi:hypothetical protein DFH27DRAFT_613983 [Peziza echinospora]|nr:hypothetical protein DFH27DRAFT_613983 [Peziza echinospora]
MFVLTVCVIMLLGWLFSAEDANVNVNTKASVNDNWKKEDAIEIALGGSILDHPQVTDKEEREPEQGGQSSELQPELSNYIGSWADEVEAELFGGMESIIEEETEDKEPNLVEAISWAEEVEAELFGGKKSISSEASAEKKDIIIITRKSVDLKAKGTRPRTAEEFKPAAKGDELEEESKENNGEEEEHIFINTTGFCCATAATLGYTGGVKLEPSAPKYVGMAAISCFYVFAPSPLRNVRTNVS